MTVEVRIDAWDISVLVLYFLAVLITGFVAMFTSQRGTVGGYFLAGRFMTWLPIGASLFASNIGSEHFIGLAGSGAASGIAVGAFELNASILLQLLGWIFLPVYIASGVYTLPEYMKRRFGGVKIQVYLACLSLLLYVFTKISVNLFSGALFLKEALHWNIWPSIILLLILTSVITIAGGLTAVLYTDTLQCFVMLVGAVVLAIMGFVRVGGFAGLLASYGGAIARINVTSKFGSELMTSLANASMANNNISNLHQLASYPQVAPSLKCGLPSEKAFVLLRGVSDPDMPWLGFLLGQTPASIWYWCADQMMVQRVLAAKSLSHAQGATLMAGLIKQLPLFIIVIPGLISRILFPDEIGCIPGDDCFRVCGQKTSCSNLAYPKLVVGMMPSGLRGLMLAVILAALVSDLTSIFNSASTLFTVDIYLRIRKHAKNFELMVVGRLFVFVLVLVSVAWVPVIKELQGGQLFVYIQTVAAYLSPPIAAIYLCAILWKRCNERGAFCGLMYGLIIGLVKLILGVVYADPVCGEEDKRPWLVSSFHYMYFALFSFLSSALVTIVLSFFGKKPTAEQVHRLTYWTAWDPMRSEEEVKLDMDVSDDVAMNNLKTTDANRNGIKNGRDSSIRQSGDPSQWCGPHGDQSNVETHAHWAFVYDVLEKKTLPVYDAPEESHITENRNHSTLRCLKHVTLWFCGCEDRPCLPEVEERACGCCQHICRRTSTECGSVDSHTLQDHSKLSKLELEQQQIRRLQKITSLSQDPRAKLGLRIGLVCIILLSIFGFVFFSVYFKEIFVGPLPLTGSDDPNLPNDVKTAIDFLGSLDVVTVN